MKGEITIFVSSVQKEFTQIRLDLKAFLLGDAFLRRKAGLPEPQFEQRSGSFVITLWRDWLTSEVLAGHNLNERQLKAINYLKIHERITNSQYQEELSVAKRTASLDLAELVAVGLIEKVGSTGKGVYYQLARGASKGQKGHSQSCRNPTKCAINRLMAQG